MKEFDKQKELIDREDWDWLIILDACRYDYFKEVYQDYLKGNLQKVVSAGSSTLEWLEKTYGDKKYENVVYISSNPYINSKGVIPADNFDGTKHFFKVIDAWDFAWSGIKTVEPEAMVKASKEADRKYPDKKKIVHYIQPHQPYLKAFDREPSLCWKLLENGFSIIQKLNSFSRVKESSEGESPGPDMETKLGKILGKWFGRRFLSHLMDFFNLPPTTPFDVYLREGRKALEEYYEYNLREALKSVSKLLKFIEGRVIVSADHGEILGMNFEEYTNGRKDKIEGNIEERGRKKGPTFTNEKGERIIYGHIPGLKIPVLIEVPWFEVKK